MQVEIGCGYGSAGWISGSDVACWWNSNSSIVGGNCVWVLGISLDKVWIIVYGL